jgi:hypothetical protein
MKNKKTKYLVTQTIYVSMEIKAKDYLDAENQMKDKMSSNDPDYQIALENVIDQFDAQEI